MKIDRRNLLQSLAAVAVSQAFPLRAATHAASRSAAPHASNRADEAYRIRVEAARCQREAIRAMRNAPNGDEDRYATRLASYSKGLPHASNGLVDAAAYAALLKACKSGRFADFAAVPIGGS
ncbi:MAG TPA: hypothetical protein VFN10_14360, partial [Thermoanaerobaculia bacterium]|nr:hypothetical protein [Thermoanaerobaculia bacterium]